MGREDEIRIIAYRIWENEDCCDGHDCEHWLKAEVIWEKKQTQGTVSKGIKAESKQVTTQNLKGKTAKQKP